MKITHMDYFALPPANQCPEGEWGWQYIEEKGDAPTKMAWSYDSFEELYATVAEQLAGYGVMLRHYTWNGEEATRYYRYELLAFEDCKTLENFDNANQH